MIEELIEIGLTKNEARVYSALLGLGSTNAGKLIKETGLHRNLVYENLERLIKKGLANYIIIKGIKYFEATEPKEFSNYVEKQKKEILEKEKRLSRLIPEIEQKRKEILVQAEAAIYKGKMGLRNVLDGLLSPKNELLIFATGWGMKEIMGPYYFEWHKKLKKNNVRGRAVLSIRMKSKEEYPYKTRYLPEEFVLPSTIAIYGGKVITIVWQEEPLVIVIDSKEASESYKTYFELLWKLAK